MWTLCNTPSTQPDPAAAAAALTEWLRSCDVGLRGLSWPANQFDARAFKECTSLLADFWHDSSIYPIKCIEFDWPITGDQFFYRSKVRGFTLPTTVSRFKVNGGEDANEKVRKHGFTKLETDRKTNDNLEESRSPPYLLIRSNFLDFQFQYQEIRSSEFHPLLAWHGICLSFWLMKRSSTRNPFRRLLTFLVSCARWWVVRGIRKTWFK